MGVKVRIKKSDGCWASVVRFGRRFCSPRITQRESFDGANAQP